MGIAAAMVALLVFVGGYEVGRDSEMKPVPETVIVVLESKKTSRISKEPVFNRNQFYQSPYGYFISDLSKKTPAIDAKEKIKPDSVKGEHEYEINDKDG